MNYKQKLGYTTLGAAIMLIGMWLSPLISPPVTAQHNGVFDHIQCTSLIVMDRKGKTAVELGSNEDVNMVNVHNKQGKEAVALASNEVLGNWVHVHNTQGQRVGVLTADEYGGLVDLRNNQGEIRAVMGVNKYGYGVVNTWDKNRYRQ